MKKILFLFLCFLVVGATSCKKWQKKYPEDTEKSKVTPFDRLTNKWWVLKNVTVNGVDSTGYIQEQFGEYKIYYSQELYNTNQNGVKRYYGSVQTEKEKAFDSVWSLSDGESVITTTDFNGNFSSKRGPIPCYLDITRYDKSTFTILKLSNTEFKITNMSTNGGQVFTNYFTTQ